MFRKWFMALGLVAVFAACGAGGSKVSGKVQVEGDADASGITVQLTGGEGGAQTVVTNADGAYLFDAVKDGTYGLAFEAADTVEARKALAVTVKGGQGGEVPAVTFTGSATLTGEVTAGASSGNTGIQVAVAGTQLVAVTADDGTFTLRGVPAGQRVLVATRDGYIAQSAVTVQRGATEAPAFVLGKTAIRPATIQGAVRYWDLRSSGDITLSIPGVVQAQAAADGTFTLAVPAGTWELWATAPGYPRQVVAKVTVAADETLELGTKKLLGAHRFGMTEPTQYDAHARLLEDGVHAIVSREGYQNLTHSLVDLRTGQEHAFLVEWDWITSPEYDWFPTRDGGAVAFGTSFHLYDGSVWRPYARFNLIDTASGAVTTVAGGIDTRPTRWWTWGYSTDEQVFFTVDTQQLHRVDVATGAHATAPANVDVVMSDPDHRLAISRTSGGDGSGVVTWVPATGTPLTALENVQVNHAFVHSGDHAMFKTGCTADTQLCELKIVSLRTGAVSTVTDGPYALGSALKKTSHPGWARIEGARNAYIRLADGVATAYPAGLTSTAAENAQISPGGDRVLFHVNGGLHVTAMPPAELPATPAATGGNWGMRWVAPTHFVATDLWAPNSLVQQRNDTRLDVPAEQVVPGSVTIYDAATTWRRASDKAWMALLHGTTEPIALTPADPGLDVALDTDVYQNNGTYPARATKDGSWTLFTLLDRRTARFTTLALPQGSTTFKRFDGFRLESDEERISNGAVAGSLLRFGGSELDVVLDLETGVYRLVTDTDVIEWDYGYWSKDGGNYFSMTYGTGRRTIEGYDVYEVGLLAF